MANEGKHERVVTEKKWLRIPDGTKVRCRLEGYEGVIDGLTEMVQGASLNPDGKTQYRVFIGTPNRKLAAEQDLLILADDEGLIIMSKAKIDYRRYITEVLHGRFTDDKFAAAL